MQDASAIDFDQPIALFPLPRCLLLPYGTIPLHIFEPRYRRMIADVVAANGVMAMGSFAGEAWKHDYAGSPPVRPCVCVCHVARHEPLPDGRSNIILRGLCRARIHREIQYSPYRLALLEPTEPQPPMDIDLTDQRQKLESLVGDPLLAQLAAIHLVRQWISSDLSTHAVIDLMCLSVTDDSDQRYALLAEPDAATRAHWLERYLADTRRIIGVAQRHSTQSDSLAITMN